MGTITQRLVAKIKGSKVDIVTNHKKLLLAAVVLFCLSWSLINPVKSIEKTIFSSIDKNESTLSQEEDETTCPQNNPAIGQTYLMNNVLASIDGQPDTNDQNQVFETTLSITQQNALLAQTSPVTLISSQGARDQIIDYTVQEGDTLSSVAASFGISLNTLLWANNLKETSVIRPGDELVILPVTGILHRIKSGETIGSIAKKYKSDTQEIIEFNALPADGAIQIGEKIVIPDGQMPIVVTASTIVSRTYYTGAGTGKSRSFPYGQCTWYVAQKRYVPWSGHAKTWLANSRAYGFQTGSTPQAGAIVVLSEGGWLGRAYGHVAYVEAVNGSWVTISEMNYTCYACKSVRTLNANDVRIRGYIY